MSCLVWPLNSASIRTLGTQFLAIAQQEIASESSLEVNVYTLSGLLASLACISIVLLVGSILLSKTRFFRRAVLSTVQSINQGYTARTYSDKLIGLKGTAQTPLRPAGKAVVQGIRYDVKTLGTYVASGATVVITDVEGTSLTVEEIQQG